MRVRSLWWILPLALAGFHLSCKGGDDLDDSRVVPAGDAQSGLPVLGQVPDFELVDQAGAHCISIRLLVWSLY